MLRWWIPFIVLFSVAMITTIAMTPVAGRIARAVGAIDNPGKRRVNKTPVPRMGGIAVMCALTAAFAVQYVGTSFWDWPSSLSPTVTGTADYPLIFLSFVLIFLTGLLDDKFQLSPKAKFAGQIVAACVAVWGGLTIDVIINPFSNTVIRLGVLAYPLTIIYLVAYCNIFNLIDGLDGLASGVAGIASLTMWIVSTLSGHFLAAALAITLAGACAGFLRYNFNPASIFLGDSGSLLIGFVLGSVSLLSVSRVAGLTAIIVPLVIAGVPIIDTFSAIVRRSRAHVSVGQADKGHMHHRLLSEGYNQRETVLFIYIWTALLCTGSVIMTQVAVGPRIGIFVVLIVGSGLFAGRLHLFDPVLLHHYDPETGEDELVAPSDPEFAAEEEKFEERHQRLL